MRFTLGNRFFGYRARVNIQFKGVFDMFSDIYTPQSELRCNADGSIDIAFYRERAQRLRREAILTLCRSMREFSRAWFRNATKSTSVQVRRRHAKPERQWSPRPQDPLFYSFWT